LSSACALYITVSLWLMSTRDFYGRIWNLEKWSGSLQPLQSSTSQNKACPLTKDQTIVFSIHWPHAELLIQLSLTMRMALHHNSNAKHPYNHFILYLVESSNNEYPYCPMQNQSIQMQNQLIQVLSLSLSLSLERERERERESSNTVNNATCNASPIPPLKHLLSRLYQKQNHFVKLHTHSTYKWKLQRKCIPSQKSISKAQNGLFLQSDIPKPVQKNWYD